MPGHPNQKITKEILMDLPTPDDLTEDEYTALADQLGGDTEDLTIEFAVVYYRNSKVQVEGPYDRRLAEIKARDRGGWLAERTKTTTYGLWTPADNRFAEFDKSAEKG